MIAVNLLFYRVSYLRFLRIMRFYLKLKFKQLQSSWYNFFLLFYLRFIGCLKLALKLCNYAKHVRLIGFSTCIKCLIIFCSKTQVSALHYLHSNRIVHRDMKPQNILICSGSYVKVNLFVTIYLLSLLKNIFFLAAFK